MTRISSGKKQYPPQPSFPLTLHPLSQGAGLDGLPLHASNACAESFFGTLKRELIYHRQYRTREEAKQNIFEYIEVFYNRLRRHSTLGYYSPPSSKRELLWLNHVSTELGEGQPNDAS